MENLLTYKRRAIQHVLQVEASQEPSHAFSLKQLLQRWVPGVDGELVGSRGGHPVRRGEASFSLSPNKPVSPWGHAEHQASQGLQGRYLLSLWPCSSHAPYFQYPPHTSHAPASPPSTCCFHAFSPLWDSSLGSLTWNSPLCLLTGFPTPWGLSWEPCPDTPRQAVPPCPAGNHTVQ